MQAARQGLCPILLTFETDVARSRLYRSQSLQVNTHFAAFFKIYKIIGIPFLILLFFQIFCTVFTIFVAILQIGERLASKVGLPRGVLRAASRGEARVVWSTLRVSLQSLTHIFAMRVVIRGPFRIVFRYKVIRVFFIQ